MNPLCHGIAQMCPPGLPASQWKNTLHDGRTLSPRHNMPMRQNQNPIVAVSPKRSRLLNPIEAGIHSFSHQGALAYQEIRISADTNIPWLTGFFNDHTIKLQRRRASIPTLAGSCLQHVTKHPCHVANLPWHVGFTQSPPHLPSPPTAKSRPTARIGRCHLSGTPRIPVGRSIHGERLYQPAPVLGRGVLQFILVGIGQDNFNTRS